MDAANMQSSVGLIRFTKGPLTGSVFPLNKPITTIGRDDTNDIVVKNDPQVSRKHIRILYNNGVWSVEKNPQSNMVTVNNQGTEQAIIQDNTIIGLGQYTAFVFLTQVRQPQPSVGMTPISPQPSSGMPPVIPTQPAVGMPPVAPRPLQNQPVQPTPYSISQPQRVPQQQNPPQSVYNLSMQGATKLGSTGPMSPNDTVVSTDFIPGTGSPSPSLIITANIDSDKQVFRLDKAVINVGKNNANVRNDIPLAYDIVSAPHLQIVQRGNDFVLIHPHPSRQKTLNGLLYKGRRILGHEHFEHTLVPGDIFRIGNEQGTLVTLTYDDGSGVQEAVAPPVQDIPLRNVKLLTIGRKPDNMVVLQHPQVSGYHAQLVQEGGSYRITDLHSTNHVYVNNNLTADQLLHQGDEIRIGPYKLIYDVTKLSQYDESNFIRIEARNLKQFGTGGTPLLSNISLSIPPRKFVALVGGSGAGKSTLMKALNGLWPAKEGQVFYNGQDYYRNIPAFSSQLGYVPQDDIVHKDLTVERALYYAAKMRLPSDFTNEQINQRINEVLEDVEMTGRRKLIVKKLSGGQRKRVSIALELLANPGVFFLDEPTSGLDPGLDRKMMLLLRKLADAGHTIVLVTHATNNITFCDYVCFLGQNGRLTYFGPPTGAMTYFGKADFAEIYSSLEPTEDNPNIPEEAETRYKTSPEYRQYITEPLRIASQKPDSKTAPRVKAPKRTKRSNPLKQFALLAQRNLELLKNDRSNLVILLLQAPLIAILLMLLVRFEVGTGVFDSANVVQCFPQIIQSTVITNKQNPDPNSQPLGLSGIKDKTTAIDCGRVLAFLNTDPNGIAYAKAKGGTTKALQDFVTTGNGINAQRALFIIAFVAVLFGCINGTREVVKEASIYQRERTVNLGIVPYIISKILVLGLFAVFQSGALLLIVEVFEPLHQGILLNPILETYITLLLTAFAGLMIGLTASAFAENEDSANSLLPFLLIPQVVFAGVEIPLKDPILQSIGVIFPTRWAMAALGSTLGLHGDHLGNDKLFGNSLTYHSTLYSIFTHSEAAQRLVLSWGALGVIIIVLAIAMGIALKRKDIRA